MHLRRRGPDVRLLSDPLRHGDSFACQEHAELFFQPDLIVERRLTVRRKCRHCPCQRLMLVVVGKRDQEDCPDFADLREALVSAAAKLYQQVIKALTPRTSLSSLDQRRDPDPAAKHQQNQQPGIAAAPAQYELCYLAPFSSGFLINLRLKTPPSPQFSKHRQARGSKLHSLPKTSFGRKTASVKCGVVRRTLFAASEVYFLASLPSA